MSDSFSDERADMATNTHLVIVVDGDIVHLNRNDMYVKVRDGSSALAITTTTPSAVPIGLCVTFDNSGGLGVLTVNGGEVRVPSGRVYVAKVQGDGNGGQLLAVPGPAEDTAIATGSLLQSAIDDDIADDREVVLPIGTITITTALTVGDGTGGSIRGLGVSDPVVDAGHADLHAYTTILYAGTKVADEAAIETQRSEWGLSNVNVLGKLPDDIQNGTGTNTPYGIRISRGSTAGTGKYKFDRVTLGGFDVAIDGGGALGEFNCDESSYYDVFSVGNGTFFRSNNIQGLSHKFYNLRASSTDIVFEYIAGGKMAVTDLFLATEGTILQLRNDESTGFGPNGSRWVFRGVDLDNQARNSYLLNCESGIDYYGHVIFDGVHLAMSGADVWDNPGIHVGDNMVVVVNNGCNIPANFVSWNTSSDESVVIFNNPKVYANVTTAADIFKTSGSTGNLRCIVNTGFQYGTYALLGVTPDSGVLYNQVLAGT